MTRHIHADLMIAYANDTSLPIQYKNIRGEWTELSEPPRWITTVEYRIKPKPPVKKYYFAYLMPKRNANPSVSLNMYETEEHFVTATHSPRSDFVWIQRIDQTMKEFPND